MANTTPHPRVILGLSTFGPDTTHGARVTDVDEAVAILDYYRSRGYDELDTARTYNGGQQEGFLRQMQWREKGARVATKIIPPQRGRTNKAEDVTESFETSLRELGTDSVDVGASRVMRCDARRKRKTKENEKNTY